MGVNSYAEIFTTLIGWHLYNVVWEVLVSTGIVFLPFLGILIEHWRTAFIDGEEAGGAAAGLRALEIDVYLALLVLMLACVPSSLTTLNRAEVFYAPPATTANPSPVTATGSAPDSTFGASLGGTPAAVKVPVWWYSVMAISAGVNSAIISGAGLTLDDLRKITDASKRASIDDAQIRFEALRFYNECYIPARTKYLTEPASAAATAAMATYGADDTEWIGSHAFRDDPNLYGAMYSDREVPGWPVHPVQDRDRIGAPVPPTWGRPSCKEWWEGGAVAGLRSKIVAAVGATSNLNSLVSTFGASLSAERRADLVAQTALDKTRLTIIPDPYVPTNSNVVKETLSGTAVTIASLITTFFTWLATAVLKPSLPFIQCLLLFGIYMLMPFMMVISRYSLAAMITGALAIFTIKMWSVLWFVTDFLDDKLTAAIYPDANSTLSALSSFYRIGDPTKAMLLNLVVMSLYLALPALWSGMMAMVGMRIGTAMSPAANASTENIISAGNSAKRLGGQAASIAAGGIGRAARAARNRMASKGPQR
jgi:type IV secretory system conjugative DNA transfer VirD4/TraG family protein